MEAVALAMRRKQQLLEEIAETRREIKGLESNPFYEDYDQREVRITDTLIHALRYTESINKIKYSNVELSELEDNYYYDTDATIGPVHYHIKFKLTFSPEDEPTFVSDLKITCYNEFIQAELKSWQNKCIRDNSLQTFQRGIVTYAELYSQREKVCNYLEEKASEYYFLEKSVEEGKYVISFKDRNTDTDYFGCKWSLIWNYATLSMQNYFSVFANSTVPIIKKNEPLFDELTKKASKLTFDRVEEIWKTIARCIMEEIRRP